MSTGQRLNMIGTYQDHLQVAINHEVLKLITSGRTPQITDTGYYLFWWRVNSFAPKIENAIKQLKSIDHQLAMRRQGLRGLPRDQRYSASLISLCRLRSRSASVGFCPRPVRMAKSSTTLRALA